MFIFTYLIFDGHARFLKFVDAGHFSISSSCSIEIPM
jgi:hypothetical protein